MEGALGDLWKDANHGVVALLVVEHGKGEHVEAVGGELAPQQPVYQVDLDAAVGKVHDLTDYKPAIEVKTPKCIFTKPTLDHT